MSKFVDFPYDFDPTNNLFLEALSNIATDEGLDNIFFIGCYPQISLLAKANLFLKSRISNQGMTNWLNHQRGLSTLMKIQGKKVWVTFENRRIPFEGADLSISFDLDFNKGKNLYFPLLFSYIDFLNTNSSYVRHKISFEELLLPRISLGKSLDSRDFACAFINNPDPVRLRFLKELSRFGKVDIFGRYANNYVEDKIGVGNKYKFVICFENDLYPGYVTEKPLEAWLSKSVPVYWGNDARGLLNSAALINCSSYDSLADAAESVASLQSQTDLMEGIIKQPLLSAKTQKPDLVGFLKQILD
jgi:hypothetical protein